MKASPRLVAVVATFAVFVPSLRAQQPAAGGLTNAALAANGTQITYKPSIKAFKNRDAAVGMMQDGNPHTRFIVNGAPYTFTVELPAKLMVEKISFTQSDYAAEASPKDLEIAFDDGQTITKSLDPTHPAKGAPPAWQDVPVGRAIKSVRVTVQSVTPGTQNYGGLGDIAVWTSANVTEAVRTSAADPGYKANFAPTAAATPPAAAKPVKGKTKEPAATVASLAGYDANTPTYVHAVSAVSAGAGKASLPPVAAPGEHPRLLFTSKELADTKTALDNTPRGKETLASFMNVAKGAVKNPPVFPSPQETASNGGGAGKTHSSNSYHAQACGFAYALTGDDQYAKQTRDILVGYAERYESYPRHSGRNKNDNSKIAFQRLSEAMWFIPLVEGYDYIYNSKSLSAADKALIDEKLLRAVIFEIRRKEPKAEVAEAGRKQPDWRTRTPENAREAKFPNWINFYNTATIMAGSMLNDQDMIDLAAAGFRTAIASGIGADGMWGEGAINYQLFAMGVMCPGFDAAAHLGINLWDASGGRFKQLFDSPLLYAYADGTMPGIGDSARGKLSGWQIMVYHYGYLRYKDPRYAYLVNTASRQLHDTEGLYFPARIFEELPEPPAVKAGSVVFDSLGNAILRDDAKYALLHYGPFVVPHSHYDKLNLILFFASTPGAAGDEVGGEPVFHFYTDPLHDQWTVQSIAHNTITVDGHSQAASAGGRPLVYEDTPLIKLMRAEAAACYPDVLLDRTVLTTPSLVIDLTRGKSGAAHTWDRTMRFRGTMEGMPADAPADAETLGAADGYQHIKVVREQPATDAWTGKWEVKPGTFTATLAGVPGQEVLSGFGPDKDALAIARQKGSSADFAACYTLAQWQNPVVSAAWLPDVSTAEDVKIFEVKQADGTTTQAFVAHRPGEWTAAGWHSDARVLYVSTKGDSTTVLVGGGKFAQNGALVVQLSAAGNALAQGGNGKLNVVSQWSPGSTAPAMAQR